MNNGEGLHFEQKMRPAFFSITLNKESSAFKESSAEAHRLKGQSGSNKGKLRVNPTSGARPAGPQPAALGPAARGSCERAAAFVRWRASVFVGPATMHPAATAPYLLRLVASRAGPEPALSRESQPTGACLRPATFGLASLRCSVLLLRKGLISPLFGVENKKCQV
jgi:hypothetical protein